MQVTREALNEMFINLNMPMAAQWSEKRLLDKISKLPDVVDEDTDAGDSSELLALVLDAVANEDAFDIADGGGSEDAPTPKKKTAKKTDKKETPKRGTSKKKAAAKKTDDEEYEDAPDDVEEKQPAPKKKPTKKKPAPRTEKTETATKKPATKKGPVKVGVIATIVEELGKATEEKPVTKEQILDVLVEKFPERPRDSMARTVSLAVPYKLRKDKGLDLQKKDNGFWIAE